MALQNIDQNTPEGAIFGANSAAKIGFYGAVPQPLRAMTTQGPVPALGAGQIVTFGTILSPVSVAANTVAEQALTVTGVLATDFIMAVNKPTAQAGLGIVNVRVSGANTLSVAFVNNTAAAVTPTATQNYNIVAVRGIAPNVVPLSPASIAANSSIEQIFSIAPVSAVGTPIILNGQFVGANITTAGTYTVPPSVKIVDTNAPAATPVALTGGITPVPSVNVGGRGAVGTAILNASGGVIGVIVNNPGSGYTAATTSLVFYGGEYLQPGMAVQVSKPTTQAGLGIGGCRVVDVNKLGITFVNPTGAAITPTAAESYSIMALPALPAISNIINIGLSSQSVVSVASITAAEQAITVNGLLATDYPVGAVKPTQLTIGLLNGRCAANAYYVAFVNPTQGAVTPVTTETYGISVLRQAAAAPLVIYTPVLTPVSVAANTTAEQTFTVTGLLFTNSMPSSVVVNKPTQQAGLSIVGARITAANTLGITFANTSSGAIIPTPGEQYTVSTFQMTNPSSTSNIHWVAEHASPTHIMAVAMANDMRQSLDNLGLVVQA